MPRQSPARRRFLAVATLGFCLGCAASEPIDIDDLAKNRGTPVGDPTGLAGAGGPGIAGTTGAGAGTTGTAGSIATAGTTGRGGAQSNITSGQAGTTGDAGTTGNAGTGGSGGNNVSGQAGTTGNAGTTGFAGTTGTAGRGGTTGTAGRGGTTGTAGTGGGSVDAGTNPDGAATQTFTDIYMTILTPFCAGSSCHNPGSQGGVGFSSQSSAYSAVKSRVTPGNGAGSRFYSTVNSGSMPRGQAKLSAANLAKIKTWIDQGALNN